MEVLRKPWSEQELSGLINAAVSSAGEPAR